LSFQDDCSFDPRIAAGQYQAQMRGTAVRHPAPDMASHSEPNDPATIKTQAMIQQAVRSVNQTTVNKEEHAKDMVLKFSNVITLVT